MGTFQVADPVADALFPKVRKAVLGLFYSNPDQRFYLREVVSLIGLGQGQIQRELARLAEAEIIERTSEGRHIYFRANPQCPVYEELRGLVTKTIGAVAVLREALAGFGERVATAFVFGSVARGEERHASDLDLIVIGDIGFAEVVDAIRDAEKRLRREVSVTVYSTEEFRTKLAEREHFVHSVYGSARMFVVGDSHEFAELLEQ